MQSFPTKSPDVIIRQEDNGRRLVLDRNRELLLVMNQTGFFIWSLCTGKNSRDDIEREIRSTFDVGNSNVKDEDLAGYIEQYLCTLEKVGLLSQCENGNTPIQE